MKTQDGIHIDFVFSRFYPGGSQQGMAPAMDYLWIKTPNIDWTKTKTR